jgi:23S rRNA (pseudouridine1915-N3)-methyltransferase
MKIVVLAVGKLRDKRVEALCEEYLDRVRRHLPVEILEVDDDAALARRLPSSGEIIALEAGGDTWTTAAFAAYVEQRMTRGTRQLTFLIGGADGLPAAVVAKANRRLSLSPLTLPHRLARLVLVEQIYRAVSIIRGEPYNR